jgi:hypothetical protein
MMTFILIAGVEAIVFYQLGKFTGMREMGKSAAKLTLTMFDLFNDFIEEKKLGTAFADSQTLAKCQDTGLLQVVTALKAASCAKRELKKASEYINKMGSGSSHPNASDAVH